MLITNLLVFGIGACLGGVVTTLFKEEDKNMTIDYEEFIKNMKKKDEDKVYECAEDDEKIEIEEI